MRPNAFYPASYEPSTSYSTEFLCELPLRTLPRSGRPSGFPGRFDEGFSEDGWLPDDEVAALHTDRIVAMTRPELIAVIRGVRADHLRPDLREGLPQTDSETLRKLVFLTRRLCRDRQRLASGSRRPAGSSPR